MKKIISMVLAVSALMCCGLPVQAEDTEQIDLSPYLETIDGQALLDALPEATRRELEQLGLDEPNPESILKQTPQSIFEYLKTKLGAEIRKPIVSIAQVLGAVVLAAFLEGVRTIAEQEKGLSQVFGVVAALTVCGSLAAPVTQCITQASEAIGACADFILSFLPVFTGVLTACGQPATASTAHLFLFWMCQVVSQFAANTLVPLLGFYLAVNLASAAVSSLNLSGIASMVKSMVTWALGLMMTLFVGLLTMSSVVSAGGDSVAVRAAKFMIGSFVPVVGGALSDAFTTAQGCLHLLKSTLGVYGLIASGVLFLPTVCQLVVWYAAVNLAAAAGEVLSLKKIAALLKAVASSLGILLALIFCFALVLVVSMTMLLLVGQGGM